VNCDDKHEYIRRIMNMEESVQHDVMKAIQDVCIFFFGFNRNLASKARFLSRVQLLRALLIFFIAYNPRV
jgi:hypothetical protein